MDELHIQPRRKYRDFRPRQAMRGFKATGVPTNLATIGLYNNSTGPLVLVVRDVQLSGTANDVVALSYQPLQLGGTTGKVQAFDSSGAPQSGLVNGIDTATVYAADYQFALGSFGNFQWTHDFPLALLIGGVSLVLQCTTAAHALNAAVLWESIAIDELDYFG
jgi:hypothetical protein